jgi:3-oxoacyl-[acyl-carrier protein] reductase
MSTAKLQGRLEGLSTIVTGAAQGIGRGIASVFAREGASVTIADINGEAGSKAAEQLARTYQANVALSRLTSRAMTAHAVSSRP